MLDSAVRVFMASHIAAVDQLGLALAIPHFISAVVGLPIARTTVYCLKVVGQD